MLGSFMVLLITGLILLALAACLAARQAESAHQALLEMTDVVRKLIPANETCVTNPTGSIFTFP